MRYPLRMARARVLVILTSVSLAACHGTVVSSDDNNGTGGSGGAPGPAVDACGGPGQTPLRRLSHHEYLNTIRDLFDGRVKTTGLYLPPDPTGQNFDNNAMALGSSSELVGAYHDAALDISSTAIAQSQLLADIPGCPPAKTDDEAACGRAFVETFGARAFRRPLSKDESDEFVAVFEKVRTDIDFQAGIQMTLAAFLEQPEFLYRIEETGQGLATIGSYETATRLSYLLWQTMPDATLFEAASKGELKTASQIEAQARRMLDDDKAKAVVIDFHRQWLDFDRLSGDNRIKDTKLYSQWSPALADAIREESDRFIGSELFDKKGTLKDILTSTKTWVNATLAKFYGVPAPASGWAEATLPDTQRAGFFTRGNFLASHAHSQNGSPPQRGNAILNRGLCVVLGSPPPNADLSNPALQADAKSKTNRQLFEARTAPASCSTCHNVINALGYALENYDATGGFRTRDNNMMVDPTSVLMGTDVDGPVSGPIELSQRMGDSEKAKACMVGFWYSFSHGYRASSSSDTDQCQTDALVSAYKKNGERFIDLLVATATAPDFVQRRSE